MMLRSKHLVTRLKAIAATLLIVDAAIATVIPVYVFHKSRPPRGMTLDWGIVLWQAAPYLFCAVLWLPWKSQAVSRAAVRVATTLLAVLLLVYPSMLINPEEQGGDMIGLQWLLLPICALVVAVLASAIFAVQLRFESTRNPG
jgi:hypothetical protein